MLTGHTGTSGHSEFLSSLAFCPAKATLAAGTNLGNILLWKHHDSLATATSQEMAWVPEPMARSPPTDQPTD